tara:strand:- start:1387 stop:1536 length:150 start_codon:yes stop_codon:yes gene_type:complete
MILAASLCKMLTNAVLSYTTENMLLRVKNEVFEAMLQLDMARFDGLVSH